MPDYKPTNAASSDVKIEKKRLKELMRRSDAPGLIYLAKWIASLMITGLPIWYLMDTVYVWPAMFIYGVFLTVPSYAMSHETAHGTAFKSRWLNETVLWITSILYMEEPLHRRYTHTNHHTFTWFVGKDSQMPFDTPMGFGGWLLEFSGIGLLRFHIGVLLRIMFGRFTPTMRAVTPDGEFGKMTRNSWVFFAAYAAIGYGIYAGYTELLWFLVIPRLMGAPIMLLFTLIQHVELQENSQSIIDSTRSFTTNAVAQFLYMNMNNHVEHHLYPQIPFHALDATAVEIKDQVPAPDRGFIRVNWEVFVVTLRRSLGLSTKAPTIRQAPHMISDGGPIERVAKRTM
ncbi:fatty acid desaturase [Curvivirga sp.]|uniref:fatty acid desaturase n=1 Tax=Curvivirga sp. TaxID=2856848 RepID=UPI003B5B2D9B